MESAIQIGTKSIDTPTLVQKLLQYRLLERLVQETIIDNLIEHISCDPVAALESFCAKRNLETTEKQQLWCQRENFTLEQMKAEAVREFRLAQFKDDTWGDRLQTYFLQRKDQLDRVVYSLIRIKSAEVAQELYFRLCDDGESFSDIAQQYSEGKEAQTGGLVGPVELTVPHPTIGKMLQVSKERQLWTPTRIGEWMVIVRFEKRIPAQLDAAMQQRLLQEQFQALLQEQMQASPVKLLPKQEKLPTPHSTPQTPQKRALQKSQLTSGEPAKEEPSTTRIHHLAS